jgi:hypothetical protein
MRRRLFVFVVMAGLVTVQPAEGQQVVLGFKSGVNRSKQVIESDSKAESISGFVLGGFVRVEFGEFFGLQPEFLVSKKGGLSAGPEILQLGSSGSVVTSFGADREAMEILYTEVAGLAHLRLWRDGPIRPYGIGGPALAIEVDCVEPLPVGQLNCQNSLQVDPGLVAGGGLDIEVAPWMLWTLEARHTWGLADINAVSPSIQNRTWSFMTGLGIVFR